MAPLLTLTTDQERATVKIDGVPYLLRGSNDLTLADYRTMERCSPRAFELCERADITDDEGRELSALLISLCAIALEAPADVQDKIGDVNRARVLEVFMERLSPRLLSAMSARRPTSRRTGAPSSRGSNGSTVATRSRGGRRSRSASSGPI